MLVLVFFLNRMMAADTTVVANTAAVEAADTAAMEEADTATKGLVHETSSVEPLTLQVTPP